MSPNISRASALTLSLAPIVGLLLLLLVLLPSGTRAAGSVTLVNDTFNCSNYPQPVDFDLVKVTITDQSVRRDGFTTGPNCTGRIGRIEIDVASGDGVKVGQGGRDLVIGGGYVRCNGNYGDVHQDGIQVMGGERITFRSLLVDCYTGTNSAMYINQGASLNGRPTDVVCDGCTLQRGPDRNRALRIGDSLRSGARNSTIVWCGDGPQCGGGEAVWYSGAETDPVNENNRIVLYGSGGSTPLPPPPHQPPTSSPPPPPAPSTRAPAPTSRPVISGRARQGETLTTSNGEWSNAPTRFVYQWLSCARDGWPCDAIRGETSTRLTLGASEVGRTVRVVITARNAYGADSSMSRPTERVDAAERSRNAVSEAEGPAPPASEPAPAPEPAPAEPAPAPEPKSDRGPKADKTDGPKTDKTDGPKTDKTDGPKTDKTNSSLKQPPAPAPAPAPSTAPAPAPAPAPADAAPANTAPPEIAGSLQEGGTLSATTGSWSGSPTGYEYKWFRCDESGEKCDPIKDATSAVYTLSNKDVGRTLRVGVIATNATGTAHEKSNMTAVVVGA